MKKASEYTRNSIRKIYHPVVTVLFRKIPPNDFIYPQMELAAQENGITLAEYCRVAVFEKLSREGYLLPEDTYFSAH